MKLVNLDHSPYAARIRIQIAKKKLPVTLIEPPVKLKTPEFFQRFPLAKIPLLELQSGEYLPESVAIMEYLEDCFPDNALRPDNPLEAAHMRVISSFTDTHLGPALSPLFRALLIPGVDVDKAQQIEVVAAVLENFNRWLKTDTPMSERTLHLGDLILAPTLWYTIEVTKLFGKDNILDNLDNVQAWWHWVNSDIDVKHVMDEMNVAYQTFISSLK